MAEFNEAHKRLEKLCRDIMKAERGVKTYYDEMERLPHGRFLVSGWDADLKKLKHYNWIRNQIAHQPGCTEENMCQAEDAAWLEEFHRRILYGTDPLTMYRKATQQRQKQSTENAKNKHCHKTNSHTGCIVTLWIIVIAAMVVPFSVAMYFIAAAIK